MEPGGEAHISALIEFLVLTAKIKYEKQASLSINSLATLQGIKLLGKAIVPLALAVIMFHVERRGFPAVYELQG